MAEAPDTWCADQFVNPGNVTGYRSLGHEVVERLGDGVDGFVMGGRLGGRRLEGIGVGFRPPGAKLDLADEITAVTDDEAFATSREVARREGLIAGQTSGANGVAEAGLIDTSNAVDRRASLAWWKSPWSSDSARAMRIAPT